MMKRKNYIDIIRSVSVIIIVLFHFSSLLKDFNYKEKPLILVNFPDFLDESFDYISFLRKQKLNRKIIIVSDISVPKTSH